MKYRIALVVLSSALSYGAQPFDTLTSINKYIAHHPAATSTVHSTPALFGLRHWIDLPGLLPGAWSPTQLKDLLVEQVHVRTRRGYALEHALMLEGHTDDQYIVFGPLAGSLYSLVRCLNCLYKQGVLNGNLIIEKPTCKLIFDGNVITHAPYALETLTLILVLMSRNPGRVFYLQGQYEYDHYVHSTQLTTERIHQRTTPLGPWLDSFFATLPLALYITDPTNPQSVLSISYFPRAITDPYAASCAQLLHTKKQLSHTQCPFISDVKVLIKGDDRLISYKAQQGLVLLPPDTGTTTWGVFSAPNRFYRTYYHFFYDAFTCIRLGKTLDTSVITLYNQDVREQAGFRQMATYTLTTGQPSKQLSLADSPFVPLFSGRPVIHVQKHNTLPTPALLVPILIGCTLDLTKGASNMSRQIKDGLSTCMNDINQAGGINGRPVKLIFMDDAYSPEKSRANIQNFVSMYKSPLILCPVGSPTLEAYIDLVAQKKIFVFFPMSGSTLFRKPDLTTIIHWRTSYTNEGKILTNYMLNHYHIKQFAILYQNDSYGGGGLIGLRQALKAAAITGYTEIPYATNTTLFQPMIARLKSVPAAGLGFFGTSTAAQEFIRQMGLEFFIGKYLFGLSGLSEPYAKRFLAEKGLSITLSECAPNPETNQMPIVQEYRDRLQPQTKAEATSTFTLEGYIAASLTAFILKQVADPYNLDSIIRVINSIKQVPFKGLMLNFNPQTHELVHKMWLDTGAPNWLEFDTD